VLDEVPPRLLGDGEHPVGAADRARHHRPEDEPVPPAHQLRVPLERQVVDRHNRGAGAAGRDDVLKVCESRSEAPKQSWQPQAHPDHLAAGLEADRLDAVRHELRMARHRGEPQAVVEVCELREQRRHVAFVSGPLPAKDVGVEDDVDHHAATSP
jgi:hypothetical protein